MFLIVTANVSAEETLLRPGDRVALVGGTFFERMQSTGALEAEIQCRRPDWKLSFRNVGWPGDDVHGSARKRFDTAEDGFERLLDDIQTADPTVVIVAYGFAEASDGSAAVDRFEPGMRRLTKAIAKTNRRVVMMTPLAMPGYRVDGYEKSIQQCTESIQRLGAESNIPVVAIQWQPSDTELSEHRLFPNADGYAQFARRLADPLVGGESCEHVSQPLRIGREKSVGYLLPGTGPSGASHKRYPTLISRSLLSERIIHKNQLFFHRYRPQNETYLLLFRKHEQGNNAAEIHMFDPLIQQADEAIWKAAQFGR